MLFWLRFFVLCFIQMFYNLFHKTSVNVQPLSPLFFEEIAAQKKIIYLFLIFVFAFACFLFVHISVDFRVPLADALGQIGSILDRFWCHVWSNCPAFSAARAELLQRLRKKLRKKLEENLQET